MFAFTLRTAMAISRSLFDACLVSRVESWGHGYGHGYGNFPTGTRQETTRPTLQIAWLEYALECAKNTVGLKQMGCYQPTA